MCKEGVFGSEHLNRSGGLFRQFVQAAGECNQSCGQFRACKRREVRRDGGGRRLDNGSKIVDFCL
jgi:hypothetical protein